MKCLRKYKWVKLHRGCLPSGKGIMGYWAKLASRSAFRKGNGVYCGFRNAVTPGMWAGGIVGLKSILGVKRRRQALWIMHELEELGYLKFSLDIETKKLSYEINDWVFACSGAECEQGAVYATDGFGFLCMPRTITDRLTKNINLFSQASDTVRACIKLGLGTRLQVLQNKAVTRLISGNEIDLTAPGKRKCAYYIILSDQETSMAFISSLFFSFLFIKLTRFADNSPGGHCPVPVNLVLANLFSQFLGAHFFRLPGRTNSLTHQDRANFHRNCSFICPIFQSILILQNEKGAGR